MNILPLVDKTAPPRFALWQLGFRPFYLLASLHAASSIALWALQFSGVLGRPYLAGPAWHAHEMLFGFTLAVIVGFLFTAGRNWTQQPTPTGWPLAGLAALWLAARVLVLTPHAGWAAAANIAFPWAAALALGLPFWSARNQRNYFFVGLLALMGVAAGLFHANRLGLVPLPDRLGLVLGLDVVLFILSVMGGRVIPMFTNNGVPGAGASRQPLVERAALGSVLALALADVAGAGPVLSSALAAVACAAHLARWALWRPWKTHRAPLVWVLHAAYLWVPIHLALRGLAAWGGAAPSLATHALTTGAIGGLVIGMMTRTTRGHTGRLLRADRVDIACYALVLAAALLRVGVPLVAPSRLVEAVQASALLWSAGFALFALRYGPMLCQARVDGQPG